VAQTGICVDKKSNVKLDLFIPTQVKCEIN
jgi:hypothetical protein